MIDHEEEHGIADEAYLFTHKQFSIAYNGNRVIEVNLTSENPVQLDEGMYVVAWHCGTSRGGEVSPCHNTCCPGCRRVVRQLRQVHLRCQVGRDVHGVCAALQPLSGPQVTAC